ncbi:MAG: hypothetical protein WKG07_01050 [Hymenobacter sp.]
MSQKPAGPGLRTDTWKMDLPHAPYLFMMAVGDFKIYQGHLARQGSQLLPGAQVRALRQADFRQHARHAGVLLRPAWAWSIRGTSTARLWPATT